MTRTAFITTLDDPDMGTGRYVVLHAIDAVGVRANGLPEPLVCVLRARTLARVEARNVR